MGFRQLYSWPLPRSTLTQFRAHPHHSTTISLIMAAIIISLLRITCMVSQTLSGWCSMRLACSDHLSTTWEGLHSYIIRAWTLIDLRLLQYPKLNRPASSPLHNNLPMERKTYSPTVTHFSWDLEAGFIWVEISWVCLNHPRATHLLRVVATSNNSRLPKYLILILWRRDSRLWTTSLSITITEMYWRTS